MTATSANIYFMEILSDSDTIFAGRLVLSRKHLLSEFHPKIVVTCSWSQCERSSKQLSKKPDVVKVCCKNTTWSTSNQMILKIMCFTLEKTMGYKVCVYTHIYWYFTLEKQLGVCIVCVYIYINSRVMYPPETKQTREIWAVISL